MYEHQEEAAKLWVDTGRNWRLVIENYPNFLPILNYQAYMKLSRQGKKMVNGGDINFPPMNDVERLGNSMQSAISGTAIKYLKRNGRTNGGKQIVKKQSPLHSDSNSRGVNPTIVRVAAEHGYIPVEEICAGLMNRSLSSVKKTIERLEREGYVFERVQVDALKVIPPPPPARVVQAALPFDQASDDDMLEKAIAAIVAAAIAKAMATTVAEMRNNSKK
jgi:hypothetical protein